MAGLEDLVPLIYHETQQSGSMLCAQHALNSLLQENYFTALDLSEFAHHLDNLEQSYNEGIRGHASANMDDTGFFSVQVLENALQVWGLCLVRWRSEAMKPYQSAPHAQLAFVLNQNQHWYTLRRFGSSGENGHWFNLDSANPSPQWVSRTYLGMYLQQAEQDGYSVFVVVPIDPSNPHPLPHTDADDVASTLPDPSSASLPSSRALSSSDPGFEDEDMDLQAALQASLAHTGREGGASSSGALGRPDTLPSPANLASRALRGLFSGFPFSTRENTDERPPDIPPNQDRYGNADVDPVSASMERNRVIMERIRQEQEAAMREQYEDEIAQFGQPQEHYSQQRQEVDVEDEDELLRRAMEESLAEPQRGDAGTRALDDEEDHSALSARPSTHTMDRVYDDDDAELQAALRASLESMPPGFILPPRAQSLPPQRLTNVPPSAETDANQVVEESETETETEAGTETETDAEGAGGEAARATREEVSIEEMRRRRLARFGG